MPLDYMNEIIDTLTELKRMHQLNLDLLEQLAVTCDWLHKTGIHLPNESTFLSLISKATALLNEIQGDTPRILQYNAIRRMVTDENNRQEGNSTRLRVL